MLRLFGRGENDVGRKLRFSFEVNHCVRGRSVHKRFRIDGGLISNARIYDKVVLENKERYYIRSIELPYPVTDPFEPTGIYYGTVHTLVLSGCTDDLIFSICVLYFVSYIYIYIYIYICIVCLHYSIDH